MNTVNAYPFVGYVNNRFFVVMGRLAFSVYLSHILTLVFVGSTLFERSPGTVASLVRLSNLNLPIPKVLLFLVFRFQKFYYFKP